jgi:hypothetical protein
MKFTEAIKEVLKDYADKLNRTSLIDVSKNLAQILLIGFPLPCFFLFFHYAPTSITASPYIFLLLLIPIFWIFFWMPFWLHVFEKMEEKK